MRPREIRRLVSTERPELSRERRILRRCHSIEDLRTAARRRVPRAVFDYTEGGAEAEVTARRNREAFESWSFRPRVLRDVSACDTSTEIFGERFPLPLLLSPTGYSRMMNTRGEMAVGAAAKSAGLPYGLSTVASTSIEELARTGHPHLWFQLYLWRDRDLAFDLVARAHRADYDALEFSVDVPVSGFRTRDVRNGLTIPPALTLRTLADISMHPSYWVSMLRSPAIEFANAPSSVGESVTIENMSAQFDPSLDWSALREIRERWDRPLVLKGPISPADARKAVELGVDGIHLSNHGGRQLDRSAPTLDLLPEVREAIGPDKLLILDSGIRGGGDLAIALALGADVGGIGRAYLYGLMAAGEPGVRHALDLIGTEFKRTMQLLGVSSVAELKEAGRELLSR